MPRKGGLSKKIALKYDLSCIIWKDGILFPKNMIFFYWTKTERRSFSKNKWKNIYVLIYKY